MISYLQQPTLPRGIRNNNPGNIILSNDNWQGKIDSTDETFEQFSYVEYGIRALGTLLINYHSAGYNTVNSIINRYAPSSENNTAAYISDVAKNLGVGVDDEIELTRENIIALAQAIVYHENGQPANNITEDSWKTGINLTSFFYTNQNKYD